MAFALALASGSATAAAAEPSLAVLESSNTLKVAGSEGEDSATGYFTLFNKTPSPVEIDLEFQAASSERVVIEEVTPSTVPPGARRIGVTFGGLEDLHEAVTGQLVVTSESEPVSQAVEVDPAAQPSAPWPEVVIFGSLALTLLLALAVVGAMPDTATLGNKAPGPKWSFSSWATTLTGTGAVFGTVLTGATFPTFPEQIAKQTLINLNLLFGVLAILGPFVFQALRSSTGTEEAEEGNPVGTNLTLLIACSVTLWAVLGEIGAFALLGWELAGHGLSGAVVLCAVALVAILAIRYFLITTRNLVSKTWLIAAAVPPAPAPGGPAPAAPPAPAEVPPPAPAAAPVAALGLVQTIDVKEIDSVHLNVAARLATVTKDAEGRSAEIDVPSAPPAPPYWPLL